MPLPHRPVPLLPHLTPHDEHNPRAKNCFLASHCDACKLVSGGENTLNQMANEGDLKITKGSVKTYTYYGDSGKPSHCPLCSASFTTPLMTSPFEYLSARLDHNTH